MIEGEVVNGCEHCYDLEDMGSLVIEQIILGTGLSIAEEEMRYMK